MPVAPQGLPNSAVEERTDAALQGHIHRLCMRDDAGGRRGASGRGGGRRRWAVAVGGGSAGHRVGASIRTPDSPRCWKQQHPPLPVSFVNLQAGFSKRCRQVNSQTAGAAGRLARMQQRRQRQWRHQHPPVEQAAGGLGVEKAHGQPYHACQQALLSVGGSGRGQQYENKRRHGRCSSCCQAGGPAAGTHGRQLACVPNQPRTRPRPSRAARAPR